MKIIVLDSVEQIAEKSLECLVGPHVAVSGGRTYAELFARWAPTVKSRIEAGETLKFFPVDERKVPFEDPQCNWKDCYEHLLLPAGLAEQKSHYVASAAEYLDLLQKEFGSSPIIFDTVFLGMGEDGHTGALFPNAESLKDTEAIVLDVISPVKPPPPRTTFGLKPIRESKTLIAIALTSGKAEIVKRLVDGDESLPITLAMKNHPNAILLLDREAASLIG